MSDPQAWSAVSAALAKGAENAVMIAPGRWVATLSNGSAFFVGARIDDGWLLLDAPLGAASVPAAACAWHLLGWTAALGGGARFTVGPDSSVLHARAEVPLDDDVDVCRRVGDACAGFRTARRTVMSEGLAMPESASAAAGTEIADLCRETGWRFMTRDHGLVAVDLDVSGTCEQALVAARGALGVAVTVAVLEASAAASEPASDVCREALGLLLLRTCGIVRMVRAATEGREGGPRPRFEVVFGSRPCAAELTHAFGALSVACGIASREAAVLWSDAPIAGAYVEEWNQARGGRQWQRQQQ